MENSKWLKTYIVIVGIAFVFQFIGIIILKVDFLRVAVFESKPPEILQKPEIARGMNLEMVLIPSGQFLFGSNEGNGSEADERPADSVLVSDFLISRTEVTQRLWNKMMVPNYGQNQVASINLFDTLAITNISWYDAIKFCNKLSESEGVVPFYKIRDTIDITSNQRIIVINYDPAADGYRLPTEAEWEYAAQFDDTTDMSNIKLYGWVNQDTSGVVKPVASLKQNKNFLYDVVGNVWEMCWDSYETQKDYYGQKRMRKLWLGEADQKTNPQNSEIFLNYVNQKLDKDYFVAKGGSINSLYKTIRVSDKKQVSVNSKSADLGFRVARSVNGRFPATSQILTAKLRVGIELASLNSVEINRIFLNSTWISRLPNEPEKLMFFLKNGNWHHEYIQGNTIYYKNAVFFTYNSAISVKYFNGNTEVITMTGLNQLSYNGRVYRRSEEYIPISGNLMADEDIHYIKTGK